MTRTANNLHESGRTSIPDADAREAMAASLRDFRPANPGWATLLLAIAVGLFVLEALGVIQDVGLVACKLTASAFPF